MIVPPDARGTRWRSVVAWSLGLMLLAAAIVAVVRQSDAVTAAWRALDHQRWAVVPLVFLPVVCLSLASLSFLVLTRRFGHVGVREMFALLGAAWLLNYLPLKPGVAGRVAYHAAVNGISFKHCIVVVVQTVVVGVSCFAAQFGLALGLATLWPSSSELSRAGVLVSPMIVAAAGVLALRGSTRWPHAWRYAASFIFRYLDSLVWGVRYALVLHLAGGTPSVAGCAAIASVSQSSALVPIGGNAIGLREWAVGLTTDALGEEFLRGGMTLAQGLSAELLNRAGEIAASIPVGVACVLWVARRLKTHRTHAA
ncbi:MAG: hypothetical protein K2Y21_15760 [Phycisphaerales bacterium]|nr:hypothetical protein [Phycisphaerales bacterium]